MLFASPSSPPDPAAGNRHSSAADHGDTSDARMPWYRRPWVWLLLGLVAGALILLWLHGCQDNTDRAAPEGTAAPAGSAKEDPDAAMRALLEVQKAHNRGLEEEILRLQGLLREDPCALPALLGSPPAESRVAPEYRPLIPTPSAPSPHANETSGAILSSNATSPHAAPTPPSNGTGSSGPMKDTGNAKPTPSSLPAPETVGDLLDKATVFILSNHNGQTGMGSGFFVAPGVIATNSHVVQGPDGRVIVGNKALGGMTQARVIAFSNDRNRDYALLRVGDELAAKVPFLMMGDGARRMERVSAWGFPGYIAEIDPKLKALAQGDIQAVPEVVYSEGVVSVVLDRTPPAILHTAAISQGNSGGPLVDGQGVVVGINTFIKQADRSYSQTNIALPAADLARFMSEQGIRASMADK